MKPCSTKGKVVNHVDDPFSFARSKALCSEVGKSSHTYWKFLYYMCTTQNLEGMKFIHKNNNSIWNIMLWSKAKYWNSAGQLKCCSRLSNSCYFTPERHQKRSGLKSKIVLGGMLPHPPRGRALRALLRFPTYSDQVHTGTHLFKILDPPLNTMLLYPYSSFWRPWPAMSDKNWKCGIMTHMFL